MQDRQAMIKRFEREARDYSKRLDNPHISNAERENLIKWRNAAFLNAERFKHWKG
jgi:hypothetical protein